jgi:hypothetical protein
MSLNAGYDFQKTEGRLNNKFFSITVEGVIFLIPAGMTPISRAFEENNQGCRRFVPQPLANWREASGFEKHTNIVTRDGCLCNSNSEFSRRLVAGHTRAMLIALLP